jgi:hypothetical protein
MAKFYVGQPVICVDDRLRRSVLARYPGMTWPKLGQRYTIRANLSAPTSNMGRLTFVLLREIRNRRARYPSGMVAELGFWEERFAPATDIGDIERAADDVSQFVKGDNSGDWDHRTKRRVRRKEDA